MTAIAIKISLNGKDVKTKAATLSDLLIEQGYGTAKVATALNGEFVPIARHNEQQLQQGDKIEVVAPRQGG